MQAEHHIEASGQIQAPPPPPLAVFSEKTEEALQSYFARGGALAEPSLFAAMCERAMRLSHASYPCPKCDSTGASKLSVDQLAARGVRLEEQRVKAEEELDRAHNDEERDECRHRAARARDELVRTLQREADCKVCRGTGRTIPRKFGRGHGDATSTACWCPTCNGSCTVGGPDRWKVKLLVENLADIPGLTVRQVVAAARSAGEQFEGDGRWSRALAVLRSMARRAVVVDDASPTQASTLDKRGALRALVALMRDPCWRCGGDGYFVPIDVRKTGNSVSPGTGSPDAIEVVEHGEIDRILDELRDDNHLAATVLEAYYGIDGNRWGATKRGRIWAVMPYTKPGATLAREAAVRFEAEHPGARLDACELLAREQDEDRKSALVNRRRREMLDQGDRAARSLFEAARRAWTRAVINSGHDARDSVRAWGHELEQRDAIEQAIDRRRDSDMYGAEYVADSDDYDSNSEAAE